MNSLPLASLNRLAMGVSRISIRPASQGKRARWKPFRPDLTHFEPGHGEQIWVHNHIMTNQVVYSHKRAMDSNRALRQLPFNGKKLKPAKLRRDFWRPMALIQFAEGAGVVGRSVFQKLREFRILHETTWGPHQADELLAMTKRQRGIALNDQKANSVADMAAVLGGAGRGNRMWVAGGGEQDEVEVEVEERRDAKDVAATEEPPERTLAEATIYWANEQDREHAESWPENITHELGLPRLPPKKAAPPGGHSSPADDIGNAAAVDRKLQLRGSIMRPRPVREGFGTISEAVDA